MDVKIIKKDEFKIAGLSLKGDSNSDFPKLWKDLFEKVPLEELEKMGSGQSYGSCYGLTQNQIFNYMAGYDVKDLNKIGRAHV